MAQLSIHIKTKGSERNGASILVSYYKINEDYHSIVRMLNHRGIDKHFLLTRAVGKDEYNSESHPTRLGFLPYNNWNALINDEMKFTSDQKYLAELMKLKDQFPQFNEAYQPQLFEI